MQDLLLTTTTKFYLCVLRRNVEKSMCELFRKANYDFSNFTVSQCLANVWDCEGEEKYICLSCHKRLKETNQWQHCVATLWQISKM